MMNDLLMATLMNIYGKALEVARNNNQTVGEKNDLYITAQQLEEILMQWKTQD